MTKQAEILLFPIQLAPADEVLRDDAYGAFQSKLAAVPILNKVAVGHYEMSPGNLRALEITNELCREFGLTPLDFSPLN